MISSILVDNIFNFVNRIGVVSDEQIIKMFEVAHGIDTIKYNINHLVNDNKINRKSDTHMLMRRQSVCETDFGQKLLSQAAWLLAFMGEKQVREYFTIDYPAQLFIIGENNICYDVTVFTFQTLNALKMAVLPKRNLMIPQGMKDETVHIAVIPDEEMANEIRGLNFDNYCILDEHNQPNYHQWEN
jgi:hypothetical protein